LTVWIAIDREVFDVEREDRLNRLAIGQVHQTRICQIKTLVGILTEDGMNPRNVGSDKGKNVQKRAVC